METFNADEQSEGPFLKELGVIAMLTFSFLGVTSLDANDDITEQKTEVSLGSFRTMCSLTGSYYTNGTTKKSRTHMQQT